jgi:hypothetical protein
MEEIFPCLKREHPATETEESRSLKQDAARDLKKRAAWFSDLEFADYRDINGHKILCVFDRYESAVASIDSGRATNRNAAAMAGLQSDLYLLFIRADEYPGSPRIGQELRVDGRKFFIQGSIVYEGVCEITLGSGAAR